MKDIVGVILAAGEGTRMKSSLPKVLHRVGGRPLLKYMLELLEGVGIKRYIVVVGHKADQVKALLRADRHVQVVRQTRLLGSADALKRTKKALADFRGNIFVVYGDTPLINPQSLTKLIQLHQANQASCSILTANFKNPTGFGRVVRDQDNRIIKIVEELDADTYQKAIGEINVGVYCFKAKELFAALDEIKPNNVKKEYYLTDIIEILVKRKAKLASFCTEDESEALGINSRFDLAQANAAINKRNIERLVSSGVSVVDPHNTYIYGDVEVGRDTIIYPHTFIEGKVKIGAECVIGPFARLRSGTILADRVEIGNFVEVVRSKIGAGSKIKHHSYIGDTTTGKAVNIGAGTITANYDGKSKNFTFIDDGAFIGVGSILIAPVKIGKKALTGAGSVVTRNNNVPAGATVVGVPARILKKKKR